MKKKWFNLSRAEGENKLVVYIYDVIDSFWGQSAKDFVQNVIAHDDISEIELHINSPGGSVFDGFAIYNFLRNHAASVTTYVDGMAASIASVIALAGDKVIVPENAYLMIHSPWMLTQGNASELLKDVEFLDKMTGTIADIYAAKTGMDREEILSLMEAETWMDGKDSLERHFADELIPAIQIAAQYRLTENYSNTPPAVKAMLAARDEADEEAGETPDTPDNTDTPKAPDDAPEPTATQTPTTEEQCRALIQPYLDKFGEQRGLAYFMAGLSLSDALEKYCAELKAEVDAKPPAAPATGCAPVNSDPDGDDAAQGTLWKTYNAITDPGEKTRFWNENKKAMRAEQQALAAVKK